MFTLQHETKYCILRYIIVQWLIFVTILVYRMENDEQYSSLFAEASKYHNSMCH